jgi:hypothetical protein
MAIPLILDVAEKVGVWFPDLGGRSIAVSEVDPFNNKTNIPTLPLAFTALISETGAQPTNGGGKITITSDFIIQFMYEPVKYNRADGTVTPFYAFYNYESLRNRLLTFMHSYRTPNNGGVSYLSLDVESNEFAVVITFRFRASEVWCREPDDPSCDDLAKEPFEIQIIGRVLRARSNRPCDPCEECVEPDPCDFARI